MFYKRLTDTSFKHPPHTEIDFCMFNHVFSKYKNQQTCIIAVEFDIIPKKTDL